MSARTWPTELCLLAAADRPALLAEVRRVASQATLHDLPSVAAELASRWRPNRLRMALVAATNADLQERLGQAEELLAQPGPLRVRDPRGLYFADEPLAREGRLAVLFPGDGSPYLNMIDDLVERFPEVREWYDLADRVAAETGRPATSGIVYPGEFASLRERRRAEHRLRQLENSGAAVLACNQGLYALLGLFSVRPDALIGHSLGDWSALCASGITSVETFLRDVEAAVLLPGHVTRADARMGLVIASREQVEAAIAEVGGEVYVAMHNGPRRVVIAGTKRPVRRVMSELAGRGLPTYRLPFVRAAHTPLSDAICEPLRNALAQWGNALPEIEIWSCTNARPYPRHVARIREIAVANIVRPVEFQQTIEAAYAAGLRLFVECGAGGQLTDCVGDILGRRPHLAVALDERQRHGITQVNHALAALAAEGCELDVGRLFADRTATPATVALAPDRGAEPRPGPGPAAAPAAVQRFLADTAAMLSAHHATVAQILAGHQAFCEQYLGVQRQVAQAWLTGAAPGPVAAPDQPAGPFIDEVLERGPDHVVVRHVLDPARQPYLVDHGLGGAVTDPRALGPLPVAPLTVSIEILAETAALLFPGQPLAAAGDLVARRPVAAEGPTPMQLRAEVREAGSARVTLTNPAEPQAPPYAEGTFWFGPRAPAPAVEPWQPAQARPTRLTAAELYSERVLFHGPCFQGISELISVGEDGIVGRLRSLPRAMLLGGPDEPPLLTDPALLDAMGQVFGYWPFEQLTTDLVVFPAQIRRITFHADPPRPGEVVDVRVKVVETGAKKLIGDIDLLAGGKVITRVEGWRFWRFNWPLDLVKMTRWPEACYATRPLAEVTPALAADGIWTALVRQPRPLELLAFLVRSIFTRDEQTAYLALPEAARRREQFFLGRLAAKEATRRWAADCRGEALNPTSIHVGNDDAGRPFLDGSPFADQAPPRVSVAHCAGWAVAAVADGPVGIDVERVRPHEESFLRLSFRGPERARLRHDGDVTALWCAKEAAAKACGLGLADPRQYRLGDGEQPAGQFTITAPDRTCWAVRVAELDGHVIALAGPSAG